MIPSTRKHPVVARLGFAALLIVAVALAGGMRRGESRRVTVLTWNIYNGAEFSGQPDMGELWQSVYATDFSQRAIRIAEIIADQQPHIICLQEVARWNGLADLDFNEHFLHRLQQRLVERGQHYDVVGRLQWMDFGRSFNYDIWPPSTLRWRESMMILARRSSQIHVHNVRTRFYNDTFTTTAPPNGVLEFRRGWVAADIVYRGKRARYVCTQLEPRGSNARRQNQAAQMIAWLSGASHPVIVMGDMSSDPASTVYSQFIDAGYADAWLVNHALFEGPTCCQSPDLQNNSSELDRRTDFVFVRGAATPVSATRVGQNQSDRTLGGLWPSDHAGVLAHIDLD